MRGKKHKIHALTRSYWQHQRELAEGFIVQLKYRYPLTPMSESQRIEAMEWGKEKLQEAKHEEIAAQVQGL